MRVRQRLFGVLIQRVQAGADVTQRIVESLLLGVGLPPGGFLGGTLAEVLPGFADPTGYAGDMVLFCPPFIGEQRIVLDDLCAFDGVGFSRPFRHVGAVRRVGAGAGHQ